LYFIKYKSAGGLTHAGTGKTVIAAFDYRNFRKKHPGEACRLLFVAHREEILTQSRDTFQGVLRDLNYFKPKILLGLTATPERMDGASILDYFDNRIAAEIRLPEAIDRKLLFALGIHFIKGQLHPRCP